MHPLTAVIPGLKVMLELKGKQKIRFQVLEEGHYSFIIMHNIVVLYDCVQKMKMLCIYLQNYWLIHGALTI